jgi:type II secretory pathway component PulJ
MRNQKHSRGAEGFTLVEVLFTLFIGMLLLTAIYVSMVSGQKSAVAIDQKIAAQQDVRSALELMTMEIGMASFNPTFAPGVWRDGPATLFCGSPAANQRVKGIQEATPNSITIEMDVGATGGIGDENNEILRYAYDGVNQRLTRETNCLALPEADRSFIGNLNANPRSVRVINNVLGINNGMGLPAIFRYFDGRANELYPDVDPNAILNIKRIDVTLGVETDRVDPNTQTPRRMIYSSSVVVRNHTINL